MNERRIILILAIMLLLGAGGVSAFLIDSDLKINEISIGENTSEIEEVWNPPASLEAGNDYQKNVKVANTGSTACFVRVMAEIEDPEVRKSVGVNFNNILWHKSDDGYYYYSLTLNPGEKTVPLFTTIHAKDNVDDFRMLIYEETVQAEGFNSGIEAFANFSGR